MTCARSFERRSLRRSERPGWRRLVVLGAIVAMSGCGKEGGPETLASAQHPWPTSPEALVQEYAGAILSRSYEHYATLHAPGVVMERPDAPGTCPPWMWEETCVPWLADGYWGRHVGSEPACFDGDVDLDTAVLEEQETGGARILLVRIAIRYVRDPDAPFGLGEVRLEFELVPHDDGWRIHRIADVTPPHCP